MLEKPSLHNHMSQCLITNHTIYLSISISVSMSIYLFIYRYMYIQLFMFLWDTLRMPFFLKEDLLSEVFWSPLKPDYLLKSHLIQEKTFVFTCQQWKIQLLFVVALSIHPPIRVDPASHSPSDFFSLELVSRVQDPKNTGCICQVLSILLFLCIILVNCQHQN